MRDTSTEFYNQLTDSLLRGHTYLAQKPSPRLLALPDPYDPWPNERLRLHDASLYHGRYYLYFGIAPALTLYVPWRMVTGTAVSDDLAVVLFAWGGYIFSCLLLFLLIESSEIPVSWLARGAAALALGLGQAAPIVLRRPRVYEVAVSAAFCFLLAGFYFLARRVLRLESGWWLTILSAIFLGLAVASRPPCAIVAVLLVILYGLYLWRKRKVPRRAYLVEFARFFVPLATAALLIGWYNYVRFDNPLEFGIRYQTGVFNYTKAVPWALRLRYLATSLYYLLICRPNVMSRFPFLELSGAALPFGKPDALPSGYFQEPIAGIIWVAPLCLVSLAVPFMLRRLRDLRWEVRAILVVLSVCGWLMFAAQCTIPAASARYDLDFAPSLLIAGLVLGLGLWRRAAGRWARFSAAAVLFCGCLWAVAVNTALSVNSYGYPLEAPRSHLFRSIAQALGAGPDAFMDGVQSLHFDAKVVFTPVPPKTREALLASGIYERWDLIFVEFESTNDLVFGYVHSGVMSLWSQSVRVALDVPHRLVVDYSAGTSELRVQLDSSTVLNVSTTFFPTSRDRVTLGEIRAGRFSVRSFAGKIDAGAGGLQLISRALIPPKIYTSSPAIETLKPAGDLLQEDQANLLHQTRHNMYGTPVNQPPELPQGVFQITDVQDHFAGEFLPVNTAGPGVVTAVEVEIVDPPVDPYVVNMGLQDQDYRLLYASGSLPKGEDRSIVALPAGTRAVRVVFLPNDLGFIRLPQHVGLRAFTNR